MELPRIEPIVEACREFGLELDRNDVSYIIAQPRIRAIVGEQSFLRRARRIIFTALSRVGRPFPEDMLIPAERQVEVGVTVAL